MSLARGPELIYVGEHDGPGRALRSASQVRQKVRQKIGQNRSRASERRPRVMRGEHEVRVIRMIFRVVQRAREDSNL